MQKRLALCLAACIAVAVCSARPAAAEDVGAARDAYARGSKAYKKRDYEAAADLFAKADVLAPNAVALEAALRAALRADRVLLGMELVRRAAGRDADGTLLEAAEEARREFAGRVGKLTIVCSGCAPTVDGKRWEPNDTRPVESGYHLVSLEPGDAAEKRLVHVVAGKSTRFAGSGGEAAGSGAGSAQPASTSPPPRAEPTPTPTAAAAATPPSIRGLSTGWFWASAGVTVALGAATALSQVDTAGKHDAYVTAPSLQGAADGEAAQTRTHVLLAFTGVALVSTAAVGIFAVRWKEPKAAPTVTGAIAPTASGAVASMRGRF